MSQLFTPDTLKDEYHQAFEKLLVDSLYTEDAKRRLRSTRTSHPNAYINLAVLAKDHHSAAFRCGAQIVLDYLV